jgi:hypothetical protein
VADEQAEGGGMTDHEVIDAIRANHIKANLSNSPRLRHHWDRAWVDPGGSIFGLGPYVKLPVDEGDETTETTIRVYAPERLRKRLAAKWERGT